MPLSVENPPDTVQINTKRGKTRKILTISLCCALLLILFLELYLLFKNNALSSLGYKSLPKSLATGKIAGYDIRLWKFYLFTRKLTSDEVFAQAKNDCLEVAPTPELSNAPPGYRVYQKSLQDKVLMNIRVNPEKAFGLLFVYKDVPETDTCWVVWAVDADGRGVAGYESKSGNMQLFGSILPKDEIDVIVKDMKI